MLGRNPCTVNFISIFGAKVVFVCVRVYVRGAAFIFIDQLTNPLT